jgi:TPP-dependent pyruvate/acetoin dehydrogenase alpha subunit
MYSTFYRSLYRIRQVEEEMARIYPSDKIRSPMHLSIGQEAVAVGVCEALRPDDIVFGTYRGHATYLAKGGDLKKMIAELYGKVDGCAKGKGGSMHLVDVEHGVMGTSAVVGTTIANAVGYAYAIKYRHQDNIVASFFGDGAVDEGVFYESLNFAALKNLPIIFICENNSYAIHAHQLTRQPSDNIVERAISCGVRAKKIENNDIFEIYESVRDAAEEIRKGNSGPILIECMTYRWREHVGPNEDYGLGYRLKQEAQKWIDMDPLALIAKKIPGKERLSIEKEVFDEIQGALEFAEESPFPDGTELYTNIFIED